MEAYPSPRYAPRFVGGSGTVGKNGVAETVADGSLSPSRFVETMLIAYVVSFVRFVMTHDVVDVLHVSPPGSAVAV